MASNNLQKELDTNGKSQKELADESGVSITTISKVYNKKKTPAPKTQAKIVQGLSKLVEKEYKVVDIFILSKKK